MSTESYLIDKSALARWSRPAVGPILDDLSARGLLAICGAVEHEILSSVRNQNELEQVREMLRGFEWLPAPDEVWDRINGVQIALAHAGQHRALSLAELVIAAAAERNQATVLHYDRDYDMIAAVTGQPSQWVVPSGTAD